MPTIFLATDHRGFALKEKIKTWLAEWGYACEDFGAYALDENDDYPEFIARAAKAVSENPDHRGIILGGSGQGEAMVANKFKGVRVAVYYGGPDDIIKLSREHNDANMLSIGASFVDQGTAKEVIKLWLDTPFSNEERHVRRLGQITAIEQESNK
jgi:ribose 5-phosphate isomerase B